MGDLVGLVAVILIFGGGIIKRFIDVMERRIERMSSSNSDVAQQIDALRQEVMMLRDTTTRYDMSIQHTLDEVQKRLSAVEQRSSYSYQQPPEPPQVNVRSGG